MPLDPHRWQMRACTHTKRGREKGKRMRRKENRRDTKGKNKERQRQGTKDRQVTTGTQEAAHSGGPVDVKQGIQRPLKKLQRKNCAQKISVIQMSKREVIHRIAAGIEGFRVNCVNTVRGASWVVGINRHRQKTDKNSNQGQQKADPPRHTK